MESSPLSASSNGRRDLVLDKELGSVIEPGEERELQSFADDKASVLQRFADDRPTTSGKNVSDAQRVKALEVENGRLTRLLSQAQIVLSRTQIDAARLLDDALAVVPDCAEADRLLGTVLAMQGQKTETIDGLRRAAAHRPGSAVINMHLGGVLCEGGQVDAGLALLKRACELAPGMAAVWYRLGLAFKMQMQFGQSIVALQRALLLEPPHVHARFALAHAQVSVGEISASVANYREVLRRHPDNSRAWFALADIKTERLSAEDVAQLKKATGKASADDFASIYIGFALAKALEDQGRYAAAFRALREANQRKRRTAPWDASAARSRVNAIMAAFAKPTPARANATLGSEVVFIASLPRSGSTLVEQILTSHPEVEGANEITDLFAVIDGESHRRQQQFPTWVAALTAEDWSRLGREYLARTKRWRMQRPRFADKNLVTWQYVGAIMRMLPGAKVVNCRRDPLETCFSCYRQLFSTDNAFSYDLDDMVSWYEDYDHLSCLWLRQFPQRVLDFKYEPLLADPEHQIRRLLDFCGLDFDPACRDFYRSPRAVLSTASAAQVRQPLHTNAPHSAHYRRQLAPIRARLRAAGLFPVRRNRPLG